VTAIAACRTCGTESREGARFCDACGAPVAERDAHAEYKQVTVLFAHVVHSMDIAAAVGAERLREIMIELVDRSSVVVQRYGGTVDKFTGDGIMAVFGAPAALEDHAVRACLAALGLQEEAKRLAVNVRERDRVELRLRVGLNSGEVIAGEIGSSALGYTDRRRSGDARHLAVAAAGTAGAGSRRWRGLRTLAGSLPRHGENAWLRGAYRLGRGNAMTAVCVKRSASASGSNCSYAVPPVGLEPTLDGF
jgi:class 3 adenylate cyclase